MSASPAWDATWFENSLHTQSMLAWRGVEAQHVVSTLRLVDNRAEQEELEWLLEQSKPAKPAMDTPKHFLLYTPFRYRSPHPSRFRPGGALGIWYGAETLYAACAEVAYWRNRFLLDSAALADTELLTEHTFFQAQIEGLAVDLMAAPWNAARAAWTQDQDYSATHALAEAAKQHQVQWIAYESVRAPGSRCAAVLQVAALRTPEAGLNMQNWYCKTRKDLVMLSCGNETLVWNFQARSHARIGASGTE